jgi:hypothetical protein
LHALINHHSATDAFEATGLVSRKGGVENGSLGHVGEGVPAGVGVALAEAVVLHLHHAFGLQLDLLHLLDQVALLLACLLPVEELQRLLQGVATGDIQMQLADELLLLLGVVLLATDLFVDG